MRRVVTIALVLLGVAVATAIVIVVRGMRSTTPPIASLGGTSVASLEWINLGGYRQAILVRGVDRRNPVLLFLHGGPGMPAMYLAHAFQRPLEKDFTVVQWDRRGAGKSFREDLAPEAMKVSELVADAEVLAQELCNRFDQDKIYLVGHSFGTYLATLLVLKRPDLFHAYVSIGQVVDDAKARRLQGDFIRNEAERRGDTKALRDLESVGASAYERWLFEYGGELAAYTSWTPLLLTALRAPEYTWTDVLRVARGSNFSSTHMSYDVIDSPLGDHVKSYPVPVFFFVGRRDWTTPYPLIEEFYQRVEAPAKELIWFENSAHFPFFEEPMRFAQEMRRVRRLTSPGQHQQLPLRRYSIRFFPEERHRVRRSRQTRAPAQK